MSLQPTAELAQRPQLFAPEISETRERRIQRRNRVPLRQHQAIATGPTWLIRPVAHLVEEECRRDVDGAEASTRMPTAGAMQHLDDVEAALIGDAAKGGGGNA